MATTFSFEEASQAPTTFTFEDLEREEKKASLREQQEVIRRQGTTTAFGGFGEELKERAGQFVKGVSQVVPSAMKTVGVIGSQPAYESEYLETGTATPKQTPTPESAPLYKAGQAVERAIDTAIPEPEIRDVWQDVARGAGQAATMLGAGAAVKIAGAGIGAATGLTIGMGAAQEFDDAFTLSRQRGDDPDTALAKSLGYATVAAMIENRLGAGRLLRQFFPAAKDGIQKLTALGVSKTLLGNFVAGGFEEGTQRVTQNWIVEGEPSMEGVKEEALPGAIVQGIVGIPAVGARSRGSAQVKQEAEVLRSSGAPATAAAVEEINLPLLEPEIREVAPLTAEQAESGLREFAEEAAADLDIRSLAEPAPEPRTVQPLSREQTEAGLREVLPVDETTDIRKAPAPIAQPVSPEIPLGINRPGVIDPSLKLLSEFEMDKAYREAKRSVNEAEKLIDESPDLESLTPQQRRKIADAQDKWTAAENERFRRNYLDTHTEDVFRKMIDLADIGSDFQKFSILADILKQRSGIKPEDVTGIYRILSDRITSHPDFKEALGGKLGKFRDWLQRYNQGVEKQSTQGVPNALQERKAEAVSVEKVPETSPKVEQEIREQGKEGEVKKEPTQRVLSNTSIRRLNTVADKSNLKVADLRDPQKGITSAVQSDPGVALEYALRQAAMDWDDLNYKRNWKKIADFIEQEWPVQPTPKIEGMGGARVKLAGSPQTYTVLETLPQTEVEKQNGEQPVRIKNERTGKEEVVLQSELTEVAAKTEPKKPKRTKADLNKALKEAGLDPSVFPDAKSKKNALERAIAKIEETQKKLRGSRSTLSMGVPKAALDLILEAARLSLKAGNGIAKALDAAIAKARELLGNNFNEDALRGQITDELTNPTELNWKALSSENDLGETVVDVQKLQEALRSGELRASPAGGALLSYLLSPSSNHPLGKIVLKDQSSSDLGFQGRFSTRKGSNVAKIEVALKTKSGKPITSSQFVRILNHELVHNAVTSKLENRSGDAAKRMGKLFEFVKGMTRGTKWENHNAMKSVDEFVAEAFSRNSFREFLASLDYSGRVPMTDLPSGRYYPNVSPTRKTAFGRFLEIVKSALGLPDYRVDSMSGERVEMITALDEAVSLSQELERQKRSLAGELIAMSEDVQPTVRKETQSKFWTGQQESGSRSRQMIRAEQWLEGKTPEQAIGAIAQSAATGTAIPGLSAEEVLPTLSILMRGLYDKLPSLKSPVEIAENLALIDRAKSLFQQQSTEAGRQLEAAKVARQMDYMAPFLVWRGLAKIAWARALGVSETVDVDTGFTKIVKDSAKEAAGQFDGVDDASMDQESVSASEKSANRIISELSKSQSDTLSWPEKTVDGVRELVKWYVSGDISDGEFIATLDGLNIGENTKRVLLGVAQRERYIHDDWQRRRSQESKIRRENEAEMRKILARARVALKLTLKPNQQAEALLNQYAFEQSDTQSWKEKTKNEVRESFKGILSGDITESEFSATMDSIGVSRGITNSLIGVARKEIESREFYSRIRAAEMLRKEIEEKIGAHVLREIKKSGIKLSTLFLDNDQATQRERRRHVFSEIRKKFPGLSTDEALRLEKALADAWEKARLKIWRQQFKKFVGLPEVAEDNILDAVQPELIRQANAGTLNDEAFRNAVAKKLGLPEISGETAQKIIALSQEAQATPEGVARNKVLQRMVDEITKAAQFSSWQILTDNWFPSVLSGTRTLAAIITGSVFQSALQTMEQIVDAAIVKANPKVGAQLLLTYAGGLVEGAMNAYDVVRTGDVTRRAEFAENINAVLQGKGRMDSLEAMLRSDTAWKKALGAQAIIRRMIVGLDYVGAIAARDTGILYNALLTSPEQLAEAQKRFNRKLSKQAKIQAKAEMGPGAKPVDIRARQLEILNEGVEYDIKDRAKVLGEIAALNAPPIGWSGYAYRMLEKLAGVLQSKYINREQAKAAAFAVKATAGLAFARAAFNMLGTAATFVPIIGGIQVARAYGGKYAKDSKFRNVFFIFDENGEPISEDRRRLMIANQMIGTALAIALYGKAAADDDDEDGFEVYGSLREYSPYERKVLDGLGIKPYTFRLNKKTGRSYSYKDLSIGGAFAVVGELRDKERREGELTEFDTTAKTFLGLAETTAIGSSYIRDLSMLRGFSQALGISAFSREEDLQGWNRVMAQLSRPASGLVPFSSLIREADTISILGGDPKVYRPSAPMDYWIASLPYVRRTAGEGPEYNAAGLPIERQLTAESRFAAEAPKDPLVVALATLVNKGIVPKFPYDDGYIKDGEKKSAKEFPEHKYRYEVETLKAWREIMLPDAAEIAKMSKKEYEDYYRKHLQPTAQVIHDEIQDEIDPEVLGRKRSKSGNRTINPRYRMKGEE